MGDVFSKVQIVRAPGGRNSVIITMVQPDGTFFRQSSPLDKDADIKALVSSAFETAKAFHKTHLEVTQNPLGVEMEPDAVE